MISRIMIFLIAVLLIAPNAIAQPGVHTVKTGGEVVQLIRKEKLDLILPEAMHDNNVDMWIHVTRAGDPDPMFPEFGSTSGYMIFTDIGDKIERAMFGSGGGGLNFDVRGSWQIAQAINGYYYGNQDPDVYNEFIEYVHDRDPKTIAVNYSDWLAVADGISHTQYLKLEKLLGPEYSARIVSAERVITDYRSRRILREVTLMTNALEEHRQVLERSLTREVITPGVTTLGDIGWWVANEFYKKHVDRGGYRTRASIPRILYTEKGKAISPPDVRFWIMHPEYVIQPGDFGTFDTGLKYLDYFVTDYKRNFYILKEGETKVPESLQYAYDQSLKAQKILRKHIKVGRTAGETLKILVNAVEDAGYIYTPFDDSRGLTADGKGTPDYVIIQKALADTDKSGISIDLHTQGQNAGSKVTVGPSMAAFRSDRGHLMINENHMFSFEFMVHTNLPERPGFPISINIEGNHIVSSRGVEWLHPPNEKIILIK